MRRSRTLSIAVVLAIFIVVTAARFWNVSGSDLGLFYLASRVLASGNGAHLYAHDPVLFNHLNDPVWSAQAVRAGIPPKMVSPYMQTPLWAWAMEPFCTHLAFRTFFHLMLIVFLLCFAGTIWITARFWAQRLLHPAWIALVCIGLTLTQAFIYSMNLGQMHILFVLPMLIALVLEFSCDKGQESTSMDTARSILAGLLLAMATAVKITPGFLVLYWLINRRWKAAISFAVSLAGLAVLTVLAVGIPVAQSFAQELSSASSILLVAFNNQSFVAWLMGYVYPYEEIFRWRILPLPHVIKLLSTALMVVFVVLGGWLDRRQLQLHAVPAGAVLAMVAATVFTPIAWSHYAVVLLLPIMLLLNAAMDGTTARSTRWICVGCGLVVWLLNLYPLSYGGGMTVGTLVHGFTVHGHMVSLVRSQFYACAIAMAAMLFLGVEACRNETT